MEIKHLTYDKIDLRKWDSCVKESVNGTVAGLSWYLNIVCDGWNALVEGDYQSVMPLPFVSKFGVKVMEIPALAQQLGIFSKGLLGQDMAENFLKVIPENYKYTNIGLNVHNHFELKDKGVVVQRNSDVLDLIQTYSLISATYSKSLKTRIHESIREKVSVVQGVNNHEFLILLEQIEGTNSQKIEQLRKLIAVAIKYRIGVLYGAYSAHNNLLAAAFFITGLNRAIIVSMAVTDNGKKHNAHYLLIDHFIKESAEKNLVLDFNSADLKSGEFGATQASCQQITINKLPWPLNLFKR